MPNQTFAKCLKTSVGQGAERRTFVLPYEGNLTETKFKLLANRLARRVESLGMEAAEHFLSESFRLAWLQSDWYTGREIDVVLSASTVPGHVNLCGPGWGMHGYHESEIVVVAS